MMASKLLLAFLPSCLFLVSLVYLDSYKLVRLRTLLQLMGAGGLAGILSYFANQRIAQGVGDDAGLVGQFAGPLVEEVLKAIPILLFWRARRIGFLVDAAIFGFAVGTGFALVENLYYLSVLPDAPLALWMARGFGTAVMHGGTTAILALMTKVLSDRRESVAFFWMLPGLAVAFAIHALFNQFLLSPLMSSVVMILALPPLLVLIFAQSERFLQRWLGSGFDLDADLLRAIRSGEFADSRPGRYLQSLREHFDGALVADMLCYIRLRAELSLGAKGLLMLRENGFAVKKEAGVEAKFAELRYLKQSIGKTGELALAPILQRSSRELWQLHMLETSD
jgi:RsiW-degrading membrane proteinase PrsW (M82 family)